MIAGIWVAFFGRVPAMIVGTGSFPDDMDGVSLLPLLGAAKPPATWRKDFMVDYHGQGREPCGLVSCPAPPANNFHL